MMLSIVMIAAAHAPFGLVILTRRGQAVLRPPPAPSLLLDSPHRWLMNLS